MRQLDLRAAVDSEFGIVARVNEHRGSPLDLPVHVFSAQLADTAAFSQVSAGPNCGGAGLDRETAWRAALGESLERYCLGYMDMRAVRRATGATLGDSCIDCGRLARIGSSSCEGYIKYTEALELEWVQGQSLTTGAYLWIPANLVYVPFFSSSGAFIDRPISTGAALAEDMENAVLRGLLEVLERDAFMLWWLARDGAPRIPDTMFRQAGVQHIVDHAHELGLRLHVFQVSSEFGVPVVVAVCRSPSPECGPSLSIGAAARLTTVEAVRKALVEMAHTRAWQTSMLHAQDAPPQPSAVRISRISDHPLYWSNYWPENPLWFEEDHGDAGLCTPLDGHHLDSAAVVETLGRVGFEAYMVDLTTPDVAALGVRVAKTIVPGLHPLEVGTVLHTDSERLVARMQRPNRLARGINPLPHPFP